MDPRPISQFSQTTNDTQFQNALYTPLPLGESNSNVGLGLQPPQPQFASYNSSARDSYASGGGGGLSGNNSALPLSAGGGGSGGGAYDFNDIDSSVGEKPSRFSRRTLLIVAAALASLAIIATAVAVPLVLVNRNNKSSSNGGSGGSGDGDGDGDGDGGPQNAIMGGDGSEVTMEDGTTFTYVNKLGGYWVSDPDNPWNNDARPNEWTPPLNTSWDYSRDRIFGCVVCAVVFKRGISN